MIHVQVGQIWKLPIYEGGITETLIVTRIDDEDDTVYGVTTPGRRDFVVGAKRLSNDGELIHEITHFRCGDDGHGDTFDVCIYKGSTAPWALGIGMTADESKDFWKEIEGCIG